jgi:beta-aspartyl-peptidase (threonine type)
MTGAVTPVVLVHGGAGDVGDGRLAAHEAAAGRAAERGLTALASGGSALDAVLAAVEAMESDPLFNAGTGGSLTDAGTLELDAAVMEGTLRRAGAVAALPPFEHPIRIAARVLEHGRHVLYAGEGARAFAIGQGFAPADPAAMITPSAKERLEAVLAGRASEGWAGGTVGAVACDARGRVAAATSTGGTVGKAVGRIGDSPILGAGTYADDALGACSATGIGETILRACLSARAVDRLETEAPEVAAKRAIDVFAERFGGSGGIILVDRLGRLGIANNTRTMTHAYARSGKRTVTGH